MTPQGTNRREGGLTSWRGHSPQFCAFTEKEIETMKGAQKWLGAQTIGWVEYPGKGWWWRELKESNKPPCCPEYTKTAPKIGGFQHLLS
jgi:hypothetical protein